jgi:hypothetical protein
MKRSKLGPGRKSLERGSTFPTPVNKAAGGASGRATGRPRRTPLKPPAGEAAKAWGSGKKPCVICGSQRVEAHHIITRQRLVAKARELGIDADRLLWDRRNKLWLCDRHHASHHSRMKPVLWAVLVEHAPKVFQFARELELEPWLERMYPKSNDRSSNARRVSSTEDDG